MSEQPERRIATLTRANAFVVSKWLRKNRDELAGQRLTMQELGKRAGEACNLPALTPGNLRSVCRDFGIPPMWIKGGPGGFGRGGIVGGKQARIVARQLLNVAAEIDRICRLLGETFDPDKTIDLVILRTIARGQKVTDDEPAAPDSPGSVPDPSA